MIKRVLLLVVVGLFLFAFSVFGQQIIVCGDGILNQTEQCDDGNNLDGDGCSSICTEERHTLLIEKLVDGIPAINWTFNGSIVIDQNFIVFSGISTIALFCLI